MWTLFFVLPRGDLQHRAHCTSTGLCARDDDLRPQKLSWRGSSVLRSTGSLWRGTHGSLCSFEDEYLHLEMPLRPDDTLVSVAAVSAWA